MKKIILLTVLGLAVLFSSCRKDFNEPEPKKPQTMEELTVPADFDWKTMTDFQMTVKGPANGIISVASPTGSIYQKAYLTSNQVYTMKITVPTYEKSVRLLYLGQDISLELTGNSMEYTFN